MGRSQVEMAGGQLRPEQRFQGWRRKGGQQGRVFWVNVDGMACNGGKGGRGQSGEALAVSGGQFR